MSALRGIAAAPLALLACAAWASAASATTYCVTTPSAPPGCTGTNETTFAAALTAASADTSGPDQIVLPSGTQTGPPAGYQYTGKVALQISGQGAGSLITLSSGGSNPVLEDAGTEAFIAIDALGIQLPTGETAGALAVKNPALVSGISITAASGSEGYGVALSGGGQLSGISVVIPAGTATAPDPAVFATGTATTTVQGSGLLDRSGIDAGGPGEVVVHRSEILAANDGAAVAAAGGSVLADDSLLEATNGASGLEAIGVSPSSTSTITATQLTIVGDSSATGVHVQGGSTGGDANVNLTDSIIANPLADSFALYSAAGTGAATASTDYDDFDQKAIIAAGTLTIGAHDTKMTTSDPSGYVDPMFANVSKGNYRLLPSSPLLSLDPTALGQTPVGTVESSVDLAGEPRITAGGRDLGAYQHQPPTLSSASAAPQTAKAGTSIKFSASATIAFKADPLTYSWHFDDGGSATGASVTHRFNTPGKHTATLAVTDVLGFAARATLTVTMTGTPTISNVRQSVSRWREASKPKRAHIAKARKLPTSTTFSFRLNESAKVKLAFTTTKSLTFNGHAGVDKVRFYGRLSNGKRLAPGKYRLVISATAFGVTVKSRTLSFTIAR